VPGAGDPPARAPPMDDRCGFGYGLGALPASVSLGPFAYHSPALAAPGGVATCRERRQWRERPAASSSYSLIRLRRRSWPETGLFPGYLRAPAGSSCTTATTTRCQASRTASLASGQLRRELPRARSQPRSRSRSESSQLSVERIRADS
jgi:hypothetical protein